MTVCLVILLASGTPLPASASGLVGFWSFDEGTGPATDFSGNANTGTLINGLTWGVGKFGYGLSFNGLDQYVEIGHSDSLNLKKELTLSAWIYNLAASNSLYPEPVYHIIASKGWAPNRRGSWTLAWDKKANDLCFCVRKSSDTGYNCVFFNYTVLSGDWHHVTAVFNNGKISLYVDGLLAAEPVALGSTGMMTNTEEVRIGALQAPTEFLQGWEGSIDEVQIYNRALTDTEIKALYQGTQSQEAASSSATKTNNSTLTMTWRSVVATPVIKPNGGNYTGPVSVTLNTATPGAAIYYTTDGTSPSQFSTLYKGPFTVAKTTVVKAKGFKNNNLGPSSEASASFNMDPFDFSLSNSGNKTVKKGTAVQNAVSATLKSGSGHQVSFSVSGLPSGASSSLSTTACGPSCSSTLTMTTTSSAPAGTFPIVVTGTGGGLSRSTSFSLTVSDTPAVATPTIIPNGGSYTGSVSVTMQTATSGASIYYTTDGSTPTQSSTLYTGSMTLASSATVKAVAFKTGYNPSAIASASFTVTQPSFDFSLSNSGNTSVTAGSSVANSINASLLSGTMQPVSFSVSGLPSGAMASLSSTSCTPSCSTLLSISTSGSTPAGNFPITITATGGGVTRTTALTLTVLLAAVTVDTTFDGYTALSIDDGVIDASGGTASTWASEDTATAHWINVAFPSPRQINSAIIHWAYNAYRQTYMTAQSVNIQYWDGSSYQTVSSLSYPGSDVASSSASFNSITTSQLRFFMPAAQGNPAYPNVFWITELDYGMDMVVPTAATPAITPNGASFSGSMSVAMQTATPDASIYYTTDGAIPNESSLLYSGAITLTNTATVKAKAFKSGHNPSAVASASFTNAGTKTVAGKIYYVAKGGSDSNSCIQAASELTPKLTIHNAVGCLRPGDTLYVKAGTYNESLMDVIPAGTSWTNAVTMAAFPGDAVTIKPSAGASWVLYFLGSDTQYIIIDGFILDGANVIYDVVKITYSDTPANSAHHIRIKNSELKNAPGQGVIGGMYSEFINLNVHNNGRTFQNHGFYFGEGNNLIEGSKIHHNAGYGVHIYNGNGYTGADNNVIRNNLIYANNQVAGAAAGAILSSGNGNMFYNNIVYGTVQGGSYGNGLDVQYGCTNCLVYNNTLYANGGVGINVGLGVAGTVIRNNIVYNNANGSITNFGTATVQSNNLFANPIFANPTATVPDFRLQSGSPAIDAGINLDSAIIPSDFDGNARPQGLAYDIGAYEYPRQ